MKRTILFLTMFFTVISVAQVNQGVQKDPAGKVLLATDTVALQSTRNLEKENSDAVKTQDHPKITRKSKSEKKQAVKTKSKVQ